MFGLWDRITGQRKAIEQQNEQEATQAHERDQRQAKELEQQQQQATESLKKHAEAERQENENTVNELGQDIETIKYSMGAHEEHLSPDPQVADPAEQNLNPPLNYKEQRLEFEEQFKSALSEYETSMNTRDFELEI